MLQTEDQHKVYDQDNQIKEVTVVLTIRRQSPAAGASGHQRLPFWSSANDMVPGGIRVINSD